MSDPFSRFNGELVKIVLRPIKATFVERYYMLGTVLGALSLIIDYNNSGHRCCLHFTDGKKGGAEVLRTLPKVKTYMNSDMPGSRFCALEPLL